MSATSQTMSVVLCASCKAEIVFLLTPAGKSMPVNADTVEPGDIEYERGKHVSHFTTCNDPNRFSSGRKGKS